MTPSLAVTSFTAAILVAMMILLSLRVILYRMKNDLSLGDHGDKELERRVRAFGNFTEYAPMSLLLLGLVEFQGEPVWPLAVLLVIARGFHAYSLIQTRSGKMHFRTRRIGMVAQLSFLMLSGIILLFV